MMKTIQGRVDTDVSEETAIDIAPGITAEASKETMHSTYQQYNPFKLFRQRTEKFIRGDSKRVNQESENESSPQVELAVMGGADGDSDPSQN